MYKLIRMNGKSLFVKRYALKYNLGVKTTAHPESIKQGFGIFVFRSLDQAIEFKQSLNEEDILIYKCKVDQRVLSKYQVPLAELELYGYTKDERIPIIGEMYLEVTPIKLVVFS